jgi:hypothetical protein
MLSDGTYISAPLPQNVKGHFGNGLKEYIIYQSHVNNVSQAKIHAELLDRGLLISEGEINNIIIDTSSALKKEYYDIAEAGIGTARNIRVDDTGARHKGKNAASLMIQNDFFTHLATGSGKSRKHFLLALRGNYSDYVIDEHALEYIKQYKPKQGLLKKLMLLIGTVCGNEREWRTALKKHDITNKNTGMKFLQIIEEAALLGSAISHGFNPNTVILSDGAKQYAIATHALCWIHAERAIRKLVSNSEKEAQEITDIRAQIWKYYKELKQYQCSPNQDYKIYLSENFDKIFEQNVNSNQLSIVLDSFRKKKLELLRVLDHPHVPLHNNSTEQDIRKAVIKRKISGGTRSDKGKMARDIFISLIGTCRKNNISPLSYIKDRIANSEKIPCLAEIILRKVNFANPPPS